MLGTQPQKSICFSCWDRDSVSYVRSILINIIVISILYFLWLIISMITHPPKFTPSLVEGMSAIKIISVFIQFITLVYSCITLAKYKKHNDHQRSHVLTWAKVELVLLIIQFLLLVISFILAFLQIIAFIESYNYNNDTAFFALTLCFMFIWLFFTTWEIYMLFMVFSDGETEDHSRSLRKQTQRVKSAPVYHDEEEKNIVHKNDEDDFIQPTARTGYIDESSNQNDNVKQPQIVESRPMDGYEDDFLGPSNMQGGYLNDSEDSKNKDREDPQFYQSGVDNQAIVVNKKNDPSDNAF